MNKLILALAISLFSFTTFADVHVKGYYRADGTYVHPYTRSTVNKEADKVVKVKGYYRKSGTHVKGYQRTVPKKK